MQPMLQGFADELVKIAKQDEDVQKALRKATRMSKRDDLDEMLHGDRHKKRDYLAAALIGAAGMPAGLMLSRGVARALKNKALRQAGQQIEKGRLATTPELAGESARGAMFGSVLQAIRDRFEKRDRSRPR
jgi:hypothetical protein